MEGSEYPDQWVIRGNHHDAWVNGATDPVSGMVAVMEEARADRRAGQDRLAAEAHPGLRRLGRRGAGPSRLGRVGGDPRRPAAQARRGLHQLRQQRPRLPGGRRLAHAGGALNQVARDVTDPQKGISRARAPACRHAASTARPRTSRWRAAAVVPHRSPRLRLGLHPLPAAPGDRLAEHRLLRRGRVRPVPLDLRLVRPLRPLHGPRRSSTASRWRRPAAASSCASPRPTSCPSRSATSPTPSGATSTRSRSSPTRCATETANRNRR